MERVKEAFGNFKNKRPRFNKKLWKKTEKPVTSTNVELRNDSFVDLHMKVADRVDNLIKEMEQDTQEDKKTVFQS